MDREGGAERGGDPCARGAALGGSASAGAPATLGRPSWLATSCQLRRGGDAYAPPGDLAASPLAPEP